MMLFAQYYMANNSRYISLVYRVGLPGWRLKSDEVKNGNEITG